MMSTAFAYARVSTKDQAVKDNSIPEQFRRIERFAEDQGIQILRTYRDSDSAYQENNRQQFKAMIAEAIQQRPTFIIMDDSSRYARNRKEAIETKDILRKHGINVRFVNEPFVDPNSVAGLWLEGIQEIKNEATSREISFHVMKGMTHNIKARDPETRWCYKNGGKAPFGYKTVYLTRGQDHKGKPILKAIWELDPETAPIMKEVIVDLYTKQQMSYNKIRDELNLRGITTTRGNHWSTGSVVELLREDRLEQYAGTAIWNRTHRHVIGQKYKSRDQWIKVENAHPAIITMDELEGALERKKLNRVHAPSGATHESSYLITGKNFEGNPMFTCGNCGSGVIGYGNSSRNWKKYICGANRTKGKLACNNDWKIDRNWLEQTILCEIEQRYTAPEKIEELVKNISTHLATINKEKEKSISEHQTELNKANNEIKNLLEAIKSGIDPSLISEEVNNLKQKKDSLEEKLSFIKKAYSKETQKVDKEALKGFFTNFKTAYENATIKEKRKLIRTFVRHIELRPEEKEIKVEFYHDHIVQSIGLGEPYHK